MTRRNTLGLRNLCFWPVLSSCVHPCQISPTPTFTGTTPCGSEHSLRSWEVYLLNSGSSSPHFPHLLLIGPNQQPPSRLSPALWAVLLVTLSWKHLCLPLSLFPSPLPSQVFSFPFPLALESTLRLCSLFSAVSGSRGCVGSWLQAFSLALLGAACAPTTCDYLWPPQTTGSPSLLLSFAPFISFASEISAPASPVCISDVRRFF